MGTLTFERAVEMTRRARAGESVDDAVKAVSGVAEPGHDVGVLVESLVDPGGHHRDVRALADRLLQCPATRRQQRFLLRFELTLLRIRGGKPSGQ